MSPKISIIVPVYNVEKYLSTCLDSLVNQTLKDIEIICVDDGSTDSSWQILQKYANDDKRIILMQQPNAGPGVARNKALVIAKGKYITFVDSDDFLLGNALEKLYLTAEKNSAEVVQFNYQFYYEKKNKYEPFDFAQHIWNVYQYDLKKIGYYNKDSFSFGRLHNLGFVACAHLYLASFLRENNIRFSETKLGEDHLFINACHLLADKIFFIPDFLYCYRRGIASSTIRVDDEVFSMFLNVSNMEKFLKDHNLYTDFSDDFEMYKVEAFRSILHQVPRAKKKLFFAQCKDLLTAEDYNILLNWKRPNNFFLKIKVTKNNKLVIKICKIPVFVKKIKASEKNKEAK